MELSLNLEVNGPRNDERDASLGDASELPCWQFCTDMLIIVSESEQVMQGRQHY